MNFHFWLDEFRSTKLRRLSKETLGSLFLSTVFPAGNELSSTPIMIFFNLIHTFRHLAHITPLVHELFRSIFVPKRLSSNYFKMNLVKFIFRFQDFSQKSRFWCPLGTRYPENRENLTISEFNEIRLGN